MAGYIIRAVIAMALSATALVAAADPKSVASDGYYFVKPTITRYQFYLKIIVLQNQDQLQLMHARLEPRALPIPGLKGFTYINEDSSTCEMYIVDPKIIYEPEFIGHELVHCIYGNFHGSQNGNLTPTPK